MEFTWLETNAVCFFLFIEVVKEEDPTNNVPDTVFSKIGLHLHRRDDHPLGILKNEIYKFFEEKFPGQYQKFDDLSPIVSTKSVSTYLLLVCIFMNCITKSQSAVHYLV